MTYVTTLFSPTLDEFEIDCHTAIYWVGDLTEWLNALPDFYNNKRNVCDFVIISVVKIGE